MGYMTERPDDAIEGFLNAEDHIRKMISYMQDLEDMLGALSAAMESNGLLSVALERTEWERVGMEESDFLTWWSKRRKKYDALIAGDGKS